MSFPSSAVFPAVVNFPVQRLTNTQKLSLPTNTPVGTEVMVTDWITAGLAGPHQRLKAPSTAQGGVFVSGGTQDGIYTTNGSNDGKDNFSMLGNGDNSVTWFTDLSNVGGPALSGFAITGGAGLIYYSLSDVATPDLASNWKNASDDSPASITVTSVTQGELDAGVTVVGAGTAGANGSYVTNSSVINTGKPGYSLVGTDGATVNIQADSAIWQNPNQFEGLVYYVTGSNNYTFPWLDSSWAEQDGDPPAPTVTRNDVASEANWEVV